MNDLVQVSNTSVEMDMYQSRQVVFINSLTDQQILDIINEDFPTFMGVPATYILVNKENQRDQQNYISHYDKHIEPGKVLMVLSL